MSFVLSPSTLIVCYVTMLLRWCRFWSPSGFCFGSLTVFTAVLRSLGFVVKVQMLKKHVMVWSKSNLPIRVQNFVYTLHSNRKPETLRFEPSMKNQILYFKNYRRVLLWNLRSCQIWMCLLIILGYLPFSKSFRQKLKFEKTHHGMIEINSSFGPKISFDRFLSNI